MVNSDERVWFLTELKAKAKGGYEYYKPFFDEMSDAYLLKYDDNFRRSLKERNKSALFYPKVNAKVKRLMDALSETYFSNEQFAVLESFINSNDEILELWQKAVDYYAGGLNLYSVFQPEFLKIGFLGTAVAKVFWDSKSRAPKIEMLDLSDVYFDPDAASSADIRYCVNRYYLTKGDILALKKQKIFKFSDELTIDESYPYERFEVYDIYYLDGDKWYLATLLDEYILRDKVELKDGLPIIVGYALPQIKKAGDESFVACYGEPPMASILPLQMEVNRARNGIIDAQNQHLTKKLIVPQSAKIDRVSLENPIAPIYTTTSEPIQVLPLPDITPAMQNLALIEQEMSETSGISPQQNGASTTRAETATMSSIMANEGSVRLQGYIRTLNETWFEPIFLRLAILVWKYGDAMFFAGYDRAEVMSFKINLNTGIGALNKEVQKKNLIEGGGLIGQHFQMRASVGDQDGAMRMVKAHEMLIKKLMPLFGIKDFDQFMEEQNGDDLNQLYGAQPPIGGASAGLPQEIAPGVGGVLDGVASSPGNGGAISGNVAPSVGGGETFSGGEMPIY